MFKALRFDGTKHKIWRAKKNKVSIVNLETNKVIHCIDESRFRIVDGDFYIW